MSQNAKTRILVVDDEAPIREVLQASLLDEGYQVFLASHGEEAIKQINELKPHIVLLDIWMPGTKDGIDVLRESRQKNPHTQFIIMSGHGTIETAVKATKLGAWDFVEKPISMEKIFILISNIILFQEERGEKMALLNRLRKSIALIGEGTRMMELKHKISEMAPLEDNILIYGETGTGKALTAQNIHYLSYRAGKPLLEVNCALLPTELIEGELFGYDKGMFAGAHVAKKGKLEMASGGTLFLERIDALPQQIIEKLIAVTKTKKMQRLGGQEELKVDVRILASSEKSIQTPLFNQNLYVAPLREKTEDLPSLVLHFAEYYAREGGQNIKNISQEAMQMLMAHQWPGNIRELKNFIERVYILTPNDQINVHDIKFAGLNAAEEGGEGLPMTISSFKTARAQFEKEYILKKLAENNGNISKTAEQIGLERSHLHRKIKSYGIDVQ